MIKVASERIEKEKAIRLCDDVFPRGLCKRDDFEDIINKIDKYAVFFIVFEENEIAGYAAMYCNDIETKNAYITMIGVREQFQRRHFGSELMKKCISYARDKDMKTVRLEVLNTNIKAKDFYAKFGFTDEKNCSEDSIYMVLSL